MNTKKMLGALLGLMTVAVLCGRSEAAATNPARLTIDVTVNASLSVKVDGVEGSTRAATITPGVAYVNTASTVTVLSDATGIAEFWKLNAHNAVKKADYSAGWTLVTSTTGVSTDQLAMQALFISSYAAAGSCPAAGNAEWNQDYAAPLTGTPVTYQSAAGTNKFASPTAIGNGSGNPDFTSAGVNNGRMRAGSYRGFCYRIVPPSDVTFTENVLAYLTITASLTQ